MINTVDIIVAIFNDESKLRRFFSEFSVLQESLSTQYQLNLIFIDDGSTDNSLETLVQLKDNSPNILIIELSRNFGKDAALTAGLLLSTSDIAIPMDVDLQDPLTAVPPMLKSWSSGDVDVVLGVRIPSVGEKGIRRWASRAYSRIFTFLTGISSEQNVGEFRLMSRVVVDAFKQFNESDRYTRGLFSWLGFRTSKIEFVREKSEDKSHFNFARLFQLGIKGIISFSAAPLRLALYIGLFGSLIGFALAFLILYLKISSEIALPGYASTMLVIVIFSSLQLLVVGILGEYIGKILVEVKHRPLYLIRNKF
jgi:glycosyltransferase involved in cell wall biosynthesis